MISACISKNGTVTRINQADWNLDPMDGSGESGITIDFDKDQLYWIEYEWQGVGGVSYGLINNRRLYYVHFQNFANSASDGAFISSPNLPVRYAISNTSTSAAELVQICSAVVSEGGLKRTGQLRYQSTGTASGSEIQTNTIGQTYAICGIQLKPTHLNQTARPTSVSVLNTTNGDVQWTLQLNPTLTSSLSYINVSNSFCRFAAGQVAGNIITASGTIIAGGYISNDLAGQYSNIESNISLGATIGGSVLDEFVLAVTPISANQDIQGGMEWREQ